VPVSRATAFVRVPAFKAPQAQTSRAVASSTPSSSRGQLASDGTIEIVSIELDLTRPEA
jgi:hypothetical protein